MNSFLVTLALYAVFFLYLMLAGAGLARTFGVLRVAAFQSSLGGLVIGFVVALFSLGAGVQVFFGVMTFMSLVLLPTAALSRARDFILPGSSALEVVCLNALVLAIGHPPESFPLFDLLFRGGYHLLLNPFVLLMPPWLGFAVSFWPSALALRLAAQGAAAGRRLRFFLNLWVQVMSIIWVLPAAIGSFIAFRAKSLVDSAQLLFACLALVYVVLTWMTLRDALSGKRTVMIGETSDDSTRRGGVARALADRMEPGGWPPLGCAFAGAFTYLLAVGSLMTFLDAQLAATIGFVSIVILGALTRVRANAPAAPSPAPSWHWAAGTLLLVVALTGLRPMAFGMIAARQKAVLSLDNAERRPPERVSPAAAHARGCALEFQGSYRLHCPGTIWPLQLTSHAKNVPDLIGLDLTGARDFALDFGQRALNCAEFPARIRAADGNAADATFLLAYVPGSRNGHEYFWLLEPDASCARIVELRRSRLVGLRPGFAYRWNAASAAARHESMSWMGEIFEAVR